jgi:hypothetical protein
MKDLFLPVFVITWVLVLSGLWVIQPDESLSPGFEAIYVGLIAVFFLLSIYFASQRRKLRKQGLPQDDELSRKVNEKAAATSFYISFILWLFLIYLQSHSEISSKWIFLFGIIGMAITFIICWLVFNRSGINYEE